MDGLTAGRMVHFHNKDDKHIAAIITRVVEPEHAMVDLAIFGGDPAAPVQMRTNVLFGVGEHTWHWIERA